MNMKSLKRRISIERRLIIVTIVLISKSLVLIGVYDQWVNGSFLSLFPSDLVSIRFRFALSSPSRRRYRSTAQHVAWHVRQIVLVLEQLFLCVHQPTDVFQTLLPSRRKQGKASSSSNPINLDQ